MEKPEGIAVSGNDIWIVDATSHKVFSYPGAALLRTSFASAAATFALDLTNTQPSDLVTDGNTIWVTDDKAETVFVYSRAGSLLGSWKLDARNKDASGITLNPAGGSDLWVVDRVDKLVYHYTAAMSLRTGSKAASSTFKLATTNAKPEGIADPPPQTSDGDSLLNANRQAVFTTSEDFQSGTHFNVNVTEAPGNLRLNPPDLIQTFPFIWISNSAEGTVSRFDTRTGIEIGRYRTGPTSATDPSRVCVTPDGDAWVANRADNATIWGNAVKILRDGFIDRNGNGVIDTCRDINGDGYITATEILPWDANADGQPDDERIALVIHAGRNRSNPQSWIYGGGARGIAVDTHGKLWVGLYNHRQYEVFDEATGQFEKVVPVNGYPYGAVIAPNGMLYSATSQSRYLDRIDTQTQQYLGTVDVQSGMYGITVDYRGVVWCSAYGGNRLIRYDTNTGEVNTYPSPNGWDSGGGIAVDRYGNVWAGKHNAGYMMKWEFAQDGKTLLTSRAVPVPGSNGSAKSASVDADGYIWTVSYSPNAFKIDPLTNQVVMTRTTGSGPYNYSDMTGSIRIGSTERLGTWTEIFDSQQYAQPWGTITMDSVAPTGSAIELRARASDDRSLLDATAWSAMNPGDSFHQLRGRYLQVQVKLTSLDAGATPSVQDLVVAAIPPPTISVAHPSDGQQSAAGQFVLISGTATAATQVGPGPTTVPNRITAVLINGTAVEVLDAGGNFFTRVDVLPGRNTFDITAIDAYGQSASTTLTLDGTQRPGGSAQLLFDVSPSFAADYARTSFDERNKLLYAELAIRNQGDYDADNPFYVGVRNISDPTVAVRDIAGVTPDGIPYYDFSPVVPGQSLAPTEITGYVNAAFHNPGRVPFTYELVFLAKLNEPPVFTSTPIVETAAGRSYTYDADATDPDGDTLTYSLVSRPPTMQIDPATGAISWLPALGDLGVQSITIHVADGRGGAAEQRFLLSVIEAPPNRPPYFTSMPVTETQLTPQQEAELLINGNFSAGNNSFLSNYQHVPPGTANTGAAQYGMRSNPNDLNPRLGSFQDHTTGTGQMMVVNGATEGSVVVWSQTVSIEDNTWYHMRAWASLAHPDSPAVLRFLINGEQVGTKSLAGGEVGQWHEFSGTWFSASATQAEVAIIDSTTAYDGNDFALDDLSLRPLSGSIAYTYDANATDPDLDPVIYALLDGPDGMQIDPASGLTTWAPSSDQVGDHSVTVQASDGRGGTDQQSFVVRVEPVPGNHPPVIVSEPVTAFSLSTVSSYVLAAAVTYPGSDPSYNGPVLLYREEAQGPLIATSSIPGRPLVNDPAGAAFSPQGELFVGNRAGNVPGVPGTISRFRVDAEGQYISSGIITGNGLEAVTGLAFSKSGELFAPNFLKDTISRFTFDGNGNAVPHGQIPLGTSGAYLEGIAISPTTGELFATEIGSVNRVRRFVFDSAGTAISNGLFTVPGAGRLHFPGFSPTGELFVPAVDNGTVYRFTFDNQGNPVAHGTISVPSAIGVAVSPAGELFVSSHYSGGIFRFSFDSMGNAIPNGFAATAPLGQLAIAPESIYRYDVTAVDPDGDSIAYSLVDAPQGMVIDPDSGMLRWKPGASDVGDHTITVRADDGRGGSDLQTFTLTVTASGSGEISGSVFDDRDGDGRRAMSEPDAFLVADVYQGVLRFDPSSGAFVDVLIPLGRGGLSNPSVVVQGPHGDLFVSNWVANGSVLRFDRSGAFLEVFASGSGLSYPNGLIFGPDGRLYVANRGSDQILRFDGRTGAFIDVFASGPFLTDPSTIEFGPDGDLYVVNVFNSKNLIRLDGVTGAFKAVVVGTYGGNATVGFDFSANGDLYLSHNLPDELLHLDGTTGAIVERFSYPGGATSVQYTTFGPDGRLYVGRHLAHDILVFDPVEKAFSTFVSSANVTLNVPGGFTFVTEVSEPGQANWIAYLDQNKNARRDPGERFTVTNENGDYVFTGLPPGQYVVAEEPKPGWRQTAPDSKTYLVTLADGQIVTGKDFGNSVVTGANLPPEFTSDPPGTASIDELLRYPAIAVDPNNDPLTFDLPLAPDGMTVHPELGVVVWQPTSEQVGAHQVVLRVKDGQGGVDIQSWTITVAAPNQPPVITSTAPSPAVVNLPYEYLVRAQDAENDAITFRLGGTPPTGMIIDTGGKLTWTPTAAYLGDQSVTVIAAETPAGQTAEVVTSQTFTLPVVATAPNDPPTITSKPRERARVGQPYVYMVDASDPNGDRLNYHLDAKPTGMIIDEGTGIVTWTPASQLLGTTQDVTVRVDDGRGGSDTQPFSVQVVSQDTNSPPTVVSTPRLTAIVGRTYTYNAVADDPEGDPVVWSLDNAPAGMSIDPLRGTIRWTPAADQAGPKDVVVRVRDVFLADATQTFTIQVRAVNLPPQITSNPLTKAGPNEPYFYAVRANDPDGDPLTFRLSAKPEGMTIDEKTGLVQWTPTAAQVGSQTVVIAVDDRQGGIDTQSYVVVVGQQAVNRPPAITSTPVYNASVGRPYQYTVTATDPEAQAIAFSLDRKPDDMTIHPSTGVITWTPTEIPAEPPTVTVVATDSAGATGKQTFVVTVRANQPPEITPPPDRSITAGATYRYDVQANDLEHDPVTFQLDDGPAGLTMDDHGRIAWTPAPLTAEQSEYTVDISFTARDSFGATDSDEFKLTVTRDSAPPTIDLQIIDGNMRLLPGSEGMIDVRIGSQLVFQVAATDNVGVVSQTLTFNGEAVALDAQGRFTRTMDASNLYEVAATATDAAGNSGDASYQLRVYDPNGTGGPVIEFARLEQSPSKPADQRTVWERQPDSLWKMKVPGKPDELVNVPSISYLTDLIGSVRVESSSGTPSPLLFLQVDYAPMDTISSLYVPAEPNDSRFQRIFRLDKPADGEIAPRFNESLLVDGNGLHPIDPTVIANGAYLLRVVAEDMNGHIQSEGIIIGIDGSAKLGNFHLDFTDLTIPLAGIPITITRSYDTLNAGIEGDFGYGWSLSVQDAQVRETVPAGTSFQIGTRVYLTDPDGKRVGFTFDPIRQGTLFGEMWTPRFKADPGVSDKLEVYETAVGAPGTIFQALGGPYNPSRYMLTTKDGSVYEYDQSAGLQKITDLSGNLVAFTDTAITHSAGASIQLVRDPHGRIKQIVDTAGNSISYTYDAAGDLDNFSNQIDVHSGTPTFSYGYRSDPAHFLDAIYDAEDTRIFKAEFDDTGRLTGSTDALGNVVQQDFDPAAFSGTITDANGNVTTLWYGEAGNMIKEQSAPVVNRITGLAVTYEKTYEYADSRHPNKETKVVEYDGTIVEHEYDAAGNTTKMTRTSKDGTESLVSKYTYDGDGNLTQLVGPDGGISTFTYRAGNAASVTAAFGDTAYATYNSAGKQETFTDFSGNTISYDYKEGCPCGTPRKVSHPDGSYELREWNRQALVTKVEYYEADGNLAHVTTTDYDSLGRKTRETTGTGPDEVVTTFVYDGNTKNVARQTTADPSECPSENVRWT